MEKTRIREKVKRAVVHLEIQKHEVRWGGEWDEEQKWMSTSELCMAAWRSNHGADGDVMAMTVPLDTSNGVESDKKKAEILFIIDDKIHNMCVMYQVIGITRGYPKQFFFI